MLDACIRSGIFCSGVFEVTLRLCIAALTAPARCRGALPKAAVARRNAQIHLQTAPIEWQSATATSLSSSVTFPSTLQDAVPEDF